MRRTQRQGGERRKGKAFPSSPAKPHKVARRARLKGFFRASFSKQEREAFRVKKDLVCLVL